MSNTKTLKGRVINKHKTEEQWYLDVYKAAGNTELREDPFIPYNGELIIYDPDSVYTERRIKIGNGVDNVAQLPFYQGNPADLLTENKTLVGAINEINDTVSPLSSIMDLTNTSWTFNDTLPLKNVSADFAVNFITFGISSDTTEYSRLTIEEIDAGPDGFINALRYDNRIAYTVDPSFWATEDYKHVTFVGGADIANPNLISLLYTCATLDGSNELILQSKIDFSLTTEDKTVVGAINELDAKSLDKISLFNFGGGAMYEIAQDENGISWTNDEVEITSATTGACYYPGESAHRVPIVPGDNVTFTVDEENHVVKINATGGSSGGMIFTTYSELKGLRDTSQLTPGAFYRITDYYCTTSQENTRAIGHRFDIIVQALSENTLSENASADYHYDEEGRPDGYFLVAEDVSWNPLKLDAVTVYYSVYEDYNDTNGTIEGLYNSSDKIMAYDYLENSDGNTVPVIYKTDMEKAINDPEFKEPDYQDAFYYVGTEELDGVLYDKWRMINEDNGPYWDGSDGYKYIYTNIIVENNTIIDEAIGFGTSTKIANIPAWEIKYCLDNDETRFAWAFNQQMITKISGYDYDEPLIRRPEFDGQEPDGSSLHYAWGTQSMADDAKAYRDPSILWYSDSEEAFEGLELYSGGELRAVLEASNGGKGVIYWMKDEHDNECPYDFKNIQFKRYMITEIEVESISDLVGHYWGITDGYNYTVDESDYIWCYTFSWLNENDEVEDLSIVGQKLTNDEGHCSGVYSNVINTISACPDNPEQYGIALNDIVCLSEWGYEEGLFYGCYSNTFGNGCRSNTFGDSCCSNTFGNDCNYNTFGSDCHSNTFGKDCPSNTFSNNCYSNTFDNYCYSNTFGDNCYSNTFGNYCSNTFGKDCHENAFDNSCYENTFGDYCNLITFGNNCSYNTFGADTELVTYAKLVHFVDGCQHIKLICSKAGDDENYLQDIVVSAGVRGTADKPRELQVSRNAPPVVFEAANTTHIILDD